MAFVKRTWKDRISEYPNRRTINDGNVTKQVTVGRDEGTVTEEGDAFDATNMNDLEERIEDAYGDVVELVAEQVAEQYDGDVIFDSVPTEHHGTGFAVTSEGVKTYVDNAIGGLSIPDELNDLSDVDISGQAQGEALVWDGTKWVNGTVSTVGNLDDLSDVDTTGKATGDSLRYNGLEWVAKPTTVEVTQAEYDQLKLDGDLVEGVHYVITDGQDVTCNLGDLNDVDVTGANTGDILVKGASGWEKSDLSGIFKKYSLTGTTNASGDITFDYKALGTCIIVSATKVRNSANSNIGFSSIGRNATNDRYIVHLTDASGSPLANQNVEVIVHYVETY